MIARLRRTSFSMRAISRCPILLGRTSMSNSRVTVHPIKAQKQRVALQKAVEYFTPAAAKKPFMPPHRESSKGLVMPIWAKVKCGPED